MWFVPIRRALRRFGIDVLHAKPEIVDIFQQQGIDTVFDVGANVGQYARLLRRWGYNGRIISFEPLSAPYRELAARARRDPAWETVNVGLGDTETRASINVSEASVFSSLLSGTQDLHAFDAASRTVRKEEVVIRRLDSILAELRGAGKKLCLKADTQGYERQVITGAGDQLCEFKCIQLELSMKPLYQNEASFAEMASLLADHNFKIALIKPFIFDSSLSLLQADVVFTSSLDLH
jgi:FkbM family methyltransferase